MAQGEKHIKKSQKRKAIRTGTASLLDKFSKYVYKGLKNGIIGAIFTSYDSGVTKKERDGTGASPLVSTVRNAVSGAFSGGVSVLLSKRLACLLMGVRLKVYGAFLATFGIYTMIYGALENFFFGEQRQIFELLFGIILAAVALPLLFSDRPLADALNDSAFGSALKAVAGIHRESFEKGDVRGRVSHGFILGAAAGVLAYLTSPYRVIFLLVFAVLVWMIVSKPEFGMVSIAFLMPFVTVQVNLLLLFFVALSLCVKLIRGKRFARFETLDASVFGVFLMILLGGIVAVSPGAYKEAVLYACLIPVYFLAVNLLKTKAWLDRVTVALVFGLSLSCLLYTVGYLGDITAGRVSVELAKLMGDTLAGSLLSGDKSVISAVSVIGLPIVLSFFVRPSFKIGLHYSAISALLLLAPVIIGGSVYSALAVCVCVLLLLLIYSRNSIYIIFAGAVTVPVASLLFPSFAARLGAAVSNGLDTFFETRVQLWKSITRTLSDFLFGGVGFGKDSFSAIFPTISGSTGEGAVHSHNTYLQIWVETGVFGLVIFLVFVWLIISSAFTVFYRIDKSRKNPALRTKGLRINIPDNLSKFTSEGKNVNIRLSVSQYCVSRRMGAAAPLCSVIGMLLYGFFDYVWYDEKIFLMFWLAAGLSAAYSRSVACELDEIESSYSLGEDRAHACEADLHG